jgi:hypothetical protein
VSATLAECCRSAINSVIINLHDDRYMESGGDDDNPSGAAADLRVDCSRLHIDQLKCRCAGL